MIVCPDRQRVTASENSGAAFPITMTSLRAMTSSTESHRWRER